MIPTQEDEPVTHSTPADTARESIINCQSVSPVIDRDIGLCPLRKRKVQKFNDSNIEKHMFHSRKLLSKYTRKRLQTALFSDEKKFKGKQLYNSHNDVV